MKLHTITGLPRSGSTLLQNILNQNPRFHATSTSPLSYMVSSIVNTASNAIEFKAMLQDNRQTAEDKLANSIRAFIESWHSGKEVIFDKSRTWASNALMLSQLYPNTKLIVMVRDLRAVFASIEKQHRKSPILDDTPTIQGKAIYDRADKLFGPEGVIGMPIIGVEDLVRRNLKNVIWVQYEAFIQNPKITINRIYSETGEDAFEHDFENIINTAQDPDGHYLYKFPHEGSGKVQAQEDWRQYLSEDLATIIMQRFAYYNQVFGYNGVK